jgi:hypothetical protein
LISPGLSDGNGTGPLSLKYGDMCNVKFVLDALRNNKVAVSHVLSNSETYTKLGRDFVVVVFMIVVFMII